MDNISPLVLMYAMFFICLLLVFSFAVVWAFGHLKRERMAEAIVKLSEIVRLVNEALQSGSTEKRNAVNNRIAEWDKLYSCEFGTPISQLSWV